MLSSSRLAKPALAVLAFAVLAFALAACTFYKPGSFSLSQPSGIGNVKVQFVLCNQTEETGGCGPNGGTGDDQSLLGIAVPKGASAPATIVANPTAGGPAIVYQRNDQVAQEISQTSQGTEHPWPPAGSEGIGYISDVFPEEEGLREWTVEPSFGLPPAAGNVPFGGPFPAALWVGSRGVGEGLASDRPLDCHPIGEEWDLDDEDEASCRFADQGQLGTSELTVASPLPYAVPVYVGGKVTVAYPLIFASTATQLPSFKLTAAATLPKAGLKLQDPAFLPGAPDAATHISPPDAAVVDVTVPKNAKPGLYEVTLTATTPQGGTVSRVAKVRVSKPALGLGGVKLNRAKGIATLSVRIPGAGTVTAAGKGIAKVKKSAKKAKSQKAVKLTIRAKGKAKKQLAEEGTVKVGAKITFKPLSGAPVTKTKRITLTRNLGA